MKKIIILFLVLVFFGCKHETNNKEVNEIISFMIDKKAFPLVPPPPINDTIKSVPKQVLDSLLSLKLKVALYPNLNDLSQNEIKSIPKKYFNKIYIDGNSSQKIKLNEVVSRKEHVIILADTIEIKKSKDFEHFDLLFWFSKFYFSEDNEYVSFSLGISRSRIAGSSALYILRKENDKWKIEYSKELEIW